MSQSASTSVSGNVTISDPSDAQPNWTIVAIVAAVVILAIVWLMHKTK